MSQITYTQHSQLSKPKFPKWKPYFPQLLQTLLTDGQIKASKANKLYKLLNSSYFPAIKSYMYNQCGLHLIRYKQENGTAIFKIQTKSSTLPTITKNDGPLVYEMYLLICANLITKRIDESFLQEPFSEEILSMIKSTNPKEEGALFHRITRYCLDKEITATSLLRTTKRPTSQTVIRVNSDFTSKPCYQYQRLQKMVESSPTRRTNESY